MELIDKQSPFQPEEPVKPENFQGRKEIIEKYLPYIKQSANGNSQHFFITGKRGMGKTSLAAYLNEYAKHKYQMVGVHILNDGVHNVESIIKQIVERILNEIQEESWADKIINEFENHVEKVGFFGTTIKFKNNEKKLVENIKDNFAVFLNDIAKEFSDKKGILIILDDINGLTESPEFANWYKSFADTMATTYRGESPVTMILASYPEKLEALYNHNPSFNRIFKHSTVEELSDEEVKDFFTKTFDKVNISIEEEALDFMVHFSSGLPNMMQEIGDGVFWNNYDEMIDKNDAYQGIIRAGNEIGEKYLKPILDSSIRSDEYLTIFKKLGADFGKSVIGKEYIFKKRDFVEKLTQHEAKVFQDFLRRARALKIIEFSGAKKSGYYKFTSNLYPVFFMIEAMKEKY